MSVKRSSVRRRRRGRYKVHRSSYMTVSQKKVKRVGKGIFALALGIVFAAMIVLSVFIYDRYIKTAIREKKEAKIAASAAEESILASSKEAETETAAVPETTASEADIKKAEQEAFEAAVLEIQPGVQFAHFTGEPTLEETGDEILDEANRLAAGYDYESAIALIKSVTGYGNNDDYTGAIAGYTAAMNGCRQYVINNNITHIFFHSLIVDPTLAFDESVAGVKVQAYNEAMTTVNEFVLMMEEMYEKGYVLVDIYDVCKMETQPDGTEVMTYQKIMLPEGKTPFILSVDDTNYYEYMTGHGYANRLVVTEDGEVLNEMELIDGTTVTGAFDVLPILEDFIEMHPDFSYRGGRAIMGITGYNGVFGYRTCDFWYNDNCEYYESNEANDKYKAEEVPSRPNLNIEEDKVTATKVADAIKAMGWRIASHTWGHKRLGQVAMSTVTWDADMWDREVKPIVGETDLLIFPYGDDFGPQSCPWQVYDYEGYNERYETMRAHGFRYFFNVDSTQYFMQRTNDYFRQGRRNLDGDRMWEAVYADYGIEGWKNRLTDLFDDVSAIIDPLRPGLREDIVLGDKPAETEASSETEAASETEGGAETTSSGSE